MPTSTRSQKNQRNSKKKKIQFCFIDYAKVFDCVDHSKLWEILSESVSCSVMPDSLQIHGPALLLCLYSPGKNTGMSHHSLLQGIFPTQGSNLGLLHCRQILYHLSYQGSKSRSFSGIPLVSVCFSKCWQFDLWSSASSKPSLYIWKFSVHRLLKTSLKDFEHNLPSM